MRATWMWVCALAVAAAVSGCLDPLSRRRSAGSSDVAYRYYETAMACIERQDLENAITNISLAVARDPTVAEYHRIYGNLLAQRGFYLDAEMEYRKAIGLDPKNDATWEGYMEAVRAQRQTVRLPGIVRDRIRIEPLNPKWHLELGRVYEENDELIGAEQAFRDASNLAKGEMAAYAHARLGLVYDQLDEPLKAQREYAESLRLNPNQPEVRTLLHRATQRAAATQPAP